MTLDAKHMPFEQNDMQRMTHPENVFCADFNAKRQEMDVKREA